MSDSLPYNLVEKIELKPCPFCGRTQNSGPPEERVRCWIGGSTVYVQCGCCKAKGFSVPLPGHIDEVKEFVHDVDLTVFGLAEDPNDWQDHELTLWMAQFAARFWNNRRPPHD